MQAQRTLRRLPRLALIPLLFAAATSHAATDPQGAINATSLTDHLVEAGCMHGRGIRAWMMEK